MRFIAVVSIMVLCWCSSYGQQGADSLMTRAYVLVNKIKDNSITGPEKEELKKLNYQIQGKGFTYEEQDKNYQASLQVIDTAISIWIAMNDTLNEANLLKYRGFLLGYLHRFAEGKNNIARAIQLFILKDRAFGVAVSQFDMSKLYEQEGKLDSALYYADLACVYWKSTSNTFRIVTNNNNFLNLLIKAKDFMIAAQVQSETESLVHSNTVEGRELIDFYYLSYQLFDATKQPAQSNRYKKLFTGGIKKMKREGKTIHSYYFN